MPTLPGCGSTTTHPTTPRAIPFATMCVAPVRCRRCSALTWAEALVQARDFSASTQQAQQPDHAGEFWEIRASVQSVCCLPRPLTLIMLQSLTETTPPATIVCLPTPHMARYASRLINQILGICPSDHGNVTCETRGNFDLLVESTVDGDVCGESSGAISNALTELQGPGYNGPQITVSVPCPLWIDCECV